MSRGERLPKPPKKLQKSLKNLLTNPTVCAIIKVQKGERKANRLPKKFEKSLKKLLTNSPTCGIIIMSRGIRVT